MAATLRYGIIGTGLMGCEHIRNLNVLDGAEVAAFADPNERSRGWARRALAGRPAVEYEDYGAMLAEAALDVVVIASPNFTHTTVLEDVLASGRHVLVEKPLCTTVADAERMRARASAHPGLVMVGMEYRFMAPTARLLEEVRKGTAGRLRMLAIREHRWPFLAKVDDWNRFSENTGGTLVEKCCHFFDLMCLIVGTDPVRVYASGAQDVNHLDERYDGRVPDILDNAFVIVDFDDGVRASLDLCMFADGARSEQEIVATGDRARIDVTFPQGELFVGTRRPLAVSRERISVDPRIDRLGGHFGATYFEHAAFAAAIRADGPVPVTVDEGFRAVALGAAAQASIERGEAVDYEAFLASSV
jgi:myo-inositol 2-dehydrogenase/D-chiro-inositol 1-dehydrogenase